LHLTPVVRFSALILNAGKTYESTGKMPCGPNEYINGKLERFNAFDYTNIKTICLKAAAGKLAPSSGFGFSDDSTGKCPFFVFRG
jgi:hypothetical protein